MLLAVAAASPKIISGERPNTSDDISTAIQMKYRNPANLAVFLFVFTVGLLVGILWTSCPEIDLKRIVVAVRLSGVEKAENASKGNPRCVASAESCLFREHFHATERGEFQGGSSALPKTLYSSSM